MKNTNEKNISFVILTYNHWDLCHQILFDLYEFNRDVLEVLVVNNGSTDVEYYQGMEWWRKSKMLPLRILELDENIGFIRGCNAGVRASRGDIVILLSNDVRIRENITNKIVDVLSKSKSIVGGKYYLQSTGWNDFEEK